jgi:RNA polymerase sigma factor (sigma-70 family)
MAAAASTCWTVIQAAAAGSKEDGAQFVQRYAPLVRAYLAARWRQSPCAGELDDAVQEVFVDCFKPDGVLARADAAGAGGFRAFLYGVVRVAALRVETRHARMQERQTCGDSVLDEISADDASLSAVFDRAWAGALVREAAELQEKLARQSGEAAERRVELLRLRFHDNLPIRDIAERWQKEAAWVHHEYARAREEFKAALMEVVAFHHPGTAAEVEQECSSLIVSLG